jgi:hypothetical protein
VRVFFPGTEGVFWASVADGDHRGSPEGGGKHPSVQLGRDPSITIEEEEKATAAANAALSYIREKQHDEMRSLDVPASIAVTVQRISSSGPGPITVKHDSFYYAIFAAVVAHCLKLTLKARAGDKHEDVLFVTGSSERTADGIVAKVQQIEAYLRMIGLESGRFLCPSDAEQVNSPLVTQVPFDKADAHNAVATHVVEIFRRAPQTVWPDLDKSDANHYLARVPRTALETPFAKLETELGRRLQEIAKGERPVRVAEAPPIRRRGTWRPILAGLTLVSIATITLMVFQRVHRQPTSANTQSSRVPVSTPPSTASSPTVTPDDPPLRTVRPQERHATGHGTQALKSGGVTQRSNRRKSDFAHDVHATLGSLPGEN